MATVFAAFGKFSSNNKGSVQNFGIVGITIASEEITKFIFFYCPCNHLEARFYGSTFIFGPAAILLVVGYLVNRRTWRLTTGLCNRTQGVGKGCKRAFHFIFIFANISSKAIIAPATWIVIAMLKGDYYACAHWPNPHDVIDGRKYFGLTENNLTLPLPCLFQAPTKFLPTDEAFIIARDLRATSHLIGWWFVAIALMFGVVIMFCLKCCSKYSYEQSKYIQRYRTHEVALFENKLDEKATEQAERIVEGFFSVPRKKEEWDQIAVINDKVTKSKRGKPIYSPLHKFVNRELLLKAEETGETVDLGLVGDAAEKKRSAVKRAKAQAAAANNAGSGTTAPPTGQAIQMMPMTVKSTTVVRPAKPPIPGHPAQPMPTKEEVHPKPPIQATQETAAVTNPEVPSTSDTTTMETGGTQTEMGNEYSLDPIKESNILDRDDSSTEEEETADILPDADHSHDNYSNSNNGGGDMEPLIEH